MTGRYHHHHGVLRADEPQSLSAQAIDGRLAQAEVVAISRRGFLGGALAGALAGLAVKLEQRTGLSLLYRQTFGKRIYLAPDDHTDYFWSANEATYQQAFVRMLDYYLDKVDQTLSNPPAFQSRWNCDGSFWVWEYEHHRTAQQFNRLMQRIGDGHIGVPLNALSVCLGGVPAEAVLRGMYYPGELERRFGVRFPVAYVMENQTRPFGLGALWAGSGAKYSWHGICPGCNTAVPSGGDREYEAYWSVGPDGSQLLVKWNSKLPDNAWVGSYAEARDPLSVVDYVSDDPGFQARYPYRVIGVFVQGWDDVETENQLIVAAAQTKTNADRQVIVSNETDYFGDFEATYAGAAGFPTLSCTFGNEWELYVATLAEVSARVKRALEKLRAAEALATLVSLQQPNFMNGREAARAQAWMNFGLYWEHNFGMVGRSGQIVTDRVDWQKRLASEMEAYVSTLHSDAVAALGSLINKSGTNPRYFVFNPLSWARTDAADFPYSNVGQVHVIDVATGQEVPSQTVTVNAQSYLRILVQNVPPAGYKVFEIQAGPGQFTGGGPTVDTASGVIENEWYKVTVANRGAITSLLDKSRGNQEFARDFSGKRINDLGAATGTLTTENEGDVSATLVATVNTSSPLKRVTRITLFRNSRRIDIQNTITQNFDTVQTWHFGFNLASPDVWHEEVGAVIRARLTTNGGHYSARAINSRYDWLTLNHFADMTGDGSVGVTLSNADCYFMKLGNSTTGTLDTQTSKIEVLAGGKVVNGNNGLPSQGGDTSFLQRFALQTHGAYDQVGAMKFALEHQNPLVTGAVNGGSAYPEDQFSLLTISNDNVLLSALKSADDGINQGIVARVWNLSNTPASFTLTLPSDPLVSAQHLTHIETPVAALPVTGGALTDSLSAQQLKTYALLPASLSANLDQHVYLPVILKNATSAGQSTNRQAPWWKTLCDYIFGR